MRQRHHPAALCLRSSTLGPSSSPRYRGSPGSYLRILAPAAAVARPDDSRPRWLLLCPPAPGSLLAAPHAVCTRPHALSPPLSPPITPPLPTTLRTAHWSPPLSQWARTAFPGGQSELQRGSPNHGSRKVGGARPPRRSAGLAGLRGGGWLCPGSRGTSLPFAPWLTAQAAPASSRRAPPTSPSSGELRRPPDAGGEAALPGDAEDGGRGERRRQGTPPCRSRLPLFPPKSGLKSRGGGEAAQPHAESKGAWRPAGVWPVGSRPASSIIGRGGERVLRIPAPRPAELRIPCLGLPAGRTDAGAFPAFASTPRVAAEGGRRGSGAAAILRGGLGGRGGGSARKWWTRGRGPAGAERPWGASRARRRPRCWGGQRVTRCSQCVQSVLWMELLNKIYSLGICVLNKSRNNEIILLFSSALRYEDFYINPLPFA